MHGAQKALMQPVADPCEAAAQLLGAVRNEVSL